MNPLDPASGTELCRLSELPAGGAREVEVHDGQAHWPVVLVRTEDQIKAFVNRCPHFSIPLNFEPNQFWIYNGDVMMCAHHSAMFRLSDGYCFDGPCQGAFLQAVPVAVRKGWVVLVKG